ncbi:hypothetical protein FQZ97_1183120 [compost metagenome]
MAGHRVQRAGAGGRAGGGSELPRAEDRAAAEAQVGSVGLPKAIDAVVANLPYQGQAASRQHLVDEVGGAELCLEYWHTLVALQRGTGLVGGPAGNEQRRRRVAHGGQVEIAAVELQRHVRPVADLTAHGGAFQVGGEAQAV